LTNRALILAALAEPHGECKESVLENALRSDDTEVMIDSLRRLGIPVGEEWEQNRLVVPCVVRSAWAKEAEFFCGNSGTTIRFLTALLATGEGRYRLDGVPRMRERPIRDLLEALQALGVEVRSEANNGCPPVVLHARGLAGGTAHIRGDLSSQFLSALIMAAPAAIEPLTIQVDGELVSIPYVTMTLGLMQRWGVTVNLEGSTRRFLIRPQPYHARHYQIEPDASSASYFWAAAAMTGGQVAVTGLATSVQGDLAFRDLLVRMGCRQPTPDTIEGGPQRGIDVDMNAISDTVMTLAVVALFAAGPTRIRNVAHIRHKETDRLAALARELRKVGAGVEEHDDGLTIHPASLHGAELDTYQDHRMAMSLALIGLRVPGIVIRDPGCVAKTFPGYWTALEKLRVS
jgi:3-phosphoshikimate 1-carboxyvinyltransferase